MSKRSVAPWASLLTLVAACRYTVVSALPDAAMDGPTPADAPRDVASDRGEADAPDEHLATRRMGLRSRAVTLTVDPGFVSSRYRMYYVGADGALWLDVRRAEGHGRVCERSLGAPAQRRLVGAPAAASPGQVLAVAAEGDRGAELWTLEPGGRSDGCERIEGTWERRATMEELGAMESAPTAIEPRTEPAGTVLVAAVFAGAGVAVLRRAPDGRWMAPSFPPPPSEGAAVRSALAAHDVNASGLVALHQARTARAWFAGTFWTDNAWYERWVDSLPPSLPAASTLVGLHAGSGDQLRTFWTYTTVSGHVLEAHAVSGMRWALTSPWLDLGAPVDAPLSAPALGYARDGDSARRSVILVVATESGPRRVFVTEADGTVWNEAVGARWRELEGTFH